MDCRRINDGNNDNNSLSDKLCVICLDTLTPTSKSEGDNNLRPNNEDSGIMIESNDNKMAPIIKGFRCKHCYHRACIRPWFELGKLSCPCCRIDLLNPCDFRSAVLSVLRKERLQEMQKWGVRDGWASISHSYSEI